LALSKTAMKVLLVDPAVQTPLSQFGGLVIVPRVVATRDEPMRTRAAGAAREGFS
jgi:hypothetical protein